MKTNTKQNHNASALLAAVAFTTTIARVADPLPSLEGVLRPIGHLRPLSEPRWTKVPLTEFHRTSETLK